MPEVVYSAEFWKRCEALLDVRPHRCAACGAVARVARRGDRFPSITVRLALVAPDGEPNDPSNVGMYCTYCRPLKKDAAHNPEAAMRKYGVNAPK